MEKKRVVITGMGAISPIGNNVKDFWKSLIEGKSGVSLITEFDTTRFDCKIAANVADYDPLVHFSTKEARHLSRFIQYALVSTREAVKQADLDIKNIEKPHRVGVLIGSGIGSMRTMEKEYSAFLNKGPKKISPFFIPKIIVNEAAGLVSIEFGAKGPTSCVTTACATGTNAIGDAARLIQYGEVDCMIAGGTESANSVLGIGGFSALKALSCRNDEPEKASRPFDLNRDGFIMGEGAGIVVLESLEYAKKRGANILGEVGGYGRTSDAYHITAPDAQGTGASNSMLFALEDGGLKIEDISYINAHGTSTKLNDKVETLAIKNIFGQLAKKVAISSTKSMTGHLLGAAGAIEFIACLCAIRDNIVPPTINYETPDPDCDLDYVPNTAREMTVDVTLSNSLGFGGHNATLIAKRFQE